MVTEEKEYVFIGGRMQGRTRDLINQLISENKKLKNDCNNLVHETDEKIEKIKKIVTDFEWRLDDVHDLIDGYYEIEDIIS